MKVKLWLYRIGLYFVLSHYKRQIQKKDFVKIVNRYSRLEGEPVKPNERQLKLALALKHQMDLFVSRMPKRFVCYEQALTVLFAARLFRFPVVMHYGVRKLEGALLAHAWTVSGKYVISGEDAHEAFHVIYSMEVKV